MDALHTIGEWVSMIGTLVFAVSSLGFVAFLFYVVVGYREQLKDLLGTFTAVRVKRGEMEVSVEAEREPKVEVEVRQEEKAVLEKPPAVEKEEALEEVEPATVSEWWGKMLDAFTAGNMEEAEAAFTKMQELEEDPSKQPEHKAMYLYLRFTYGDVSALGELQELTNQRDASAAAHHWLGQCYEDSGDFGRASEAYEMSATNRETEEGRAQSAVRAASCVFKSGRQKEAYARIMQEIAKLTVPDAVSALYEGLASLYELANERELRAVALEKALEVRPNDTRLRFGAAYSYGEKDLESLALLHYTILLHFEPDHGVALNNAGVAYQRLQMPMHAVESYKAGAKAKNTLAAANVAFKLINAGFQEEASRILDEARQQEHVHANVGSAISAISERAKAEADAQERTLDAAREQQRFLISFAEAYFTQQPEPPSFAGVWRFADDVEATITETEGQIEANWLRDSKKHRFTGAPSNLGARVTVHKMQYVLSDKEIGFAEDGRGYAYLSSDAQELSIMILREHEHSFVTLVRAG